MLDFLILALATWRLSSLLSVELGPFNIFDRLRAACGVELDAQGGMVGTNWFARGLICVWCASVWIGVVLGVAYWLWPDVTWVVLPFALSAGAVIVQEIAS